MRRHIIAHPRFQFQFMVYFLAGLWILLLILGGAGLGTLSIISNQSFLSPDQKLFIAARMNSLFRILAGTGAVLSVVFVFAGYLLSFRIVGPLNRLEIWLERVLQGLGPKPLNVRPGDDMHRIVSLLNRLQSKAARAGGN